MDTVLELASLLYNLLVKKHAESYNILPSEIVNSDKIAIIMDERHLPAKPELMHVRFAIQDIERLINFPGPIYITNSAISKFILLVLSELGSAKADAGLHEQEVAVLQALYDNERKLRANQFPLVFVVAGVVVGFISGILASIALFSGAPTP